MKKMWLKAEKNFLPMHIIAVGIIVLLLYCLLPRFKIGIVDMNKVYSNAEVFKSIRMEQQLLESEWKQQALAKRKELEEADKNLSRKKARMKRSQFEKEVSALKEKILDFQNQQMAKLDLIRYQANQISMRVEETMKPMIGQVAQRKKLKFVLSDSNVLYHSQAVDVTDDVIKQLDKAFQDGQLSNLQISFSEGE